MIALTNLSTTLRDLHTLHRTLDDVVRHGTTASEAMGRLVARMESGISAGDTVIQRRLGAHATVPDRVVGGADAVAAAKLVSTAKRELAAIAKLGIPAAQPAGRPAWATHTPTATELTERAARQVDYTGQQLPGAHRNTITGAPSTLRVAAGDVGAQARNSRAVIDQAVHGWSTLRAGVEDTIHSLGGTVAPR